MIPHFKSIIGQIAALQIVVVAAACIAMPIALYYLLSEAVDQLHRGALFEQAAEIKSHLHRTVRDWNLNLPPDLADAFAEAYGRYSYAVVDGSNRVLFSSFADGSALIRIDPHLDVPYYFNRKRGSSDIAGASVPFVVDDQKVWIQTAEDLSHRDVLLDDIVTEFFPRVGWITAPILVLLLLIEIVIVRAGLKPILTASRLAARIGPTATDIRLPEKGLPGEIVPLVHAINAALDRLEQHIKAQREFTGNVAHELRTPLAILRTNVDVIDDQRLASALRQDIDVMSRRVDQLLNVAEIDTLIIRADETADLQAVCTDIVSYMAPLAVKQEKSLAVVEPLRPVVIHGNADVLGQAVRNLVENALAHTPIGTTVELRITDEPAIIVLDEGPGIPVADRERIFQRFWRRDRRRTGSSGLGLSIVSRIAEAHQGKVSVENRPSGGAAFTIRFDPSALVQVPATAEKSDAAGGPESHPAAGLNAGHRAH